MGEDSLQVLIVDADGVVFDVKDEEGNYLWQRNLEADIGIHPKQLDLIFQDVWEDAACGRVDLIEHLDKVFQSAQFHSLNLTAQKFIDYWCEHSCSINTDVLKLIKETELPSYLATNQEKYRTQMITKRVDGYFRGCFTSCQIGYAKPDSRFFESIEKTLNLPAPSLFLIDDTAGHVEAARARGWQGYVYRGDREELKFMLGAIKREDLRCSMKTP